MLTLLFVEAVRGGGGEGKAFPLHAPAASIWCCCLELGCGVCETLGAPIPSESAGAKMSMVNFAFHFLDLSMPTLWAPGWFFWWHCAQWTLLGIPLSYHIPYLGQMDFWVAERAPTWNSRTCNHPGSSSLVPSHLLNQASPGIWTLVELLSCLLEKNLPPPSQACGPPASSGFG